MPQDWSFENLGYRERTYGTHNYHRYPAKFIPQIAKKLITEYSQPGDLICDPFCGSGTALVEALIEGRNAYGVDINPIATLNGGLRACRQWLNPGWCTHCCVGAM